VIHSWYIEQAFPTGGNFLMGEGLSGSKVLGKRIPHLHPVGLVSVRKHANLEIPFVSQELHNVPIPFVIGYEPALVLQAEVVQPVCVPFPYGIIIRFEDYRFVENALGA
jgi:hypothetical protein